jgi:two-component system, OmpR family, phosphate regulon response regulator OmpR
MKPRVPAATVLVVAEDQHLRRILRWTLEDEGIAVTIAESSSAARTMLRRWRPALIVIDLPLRHADGERLLAGGGRSGKVPSIIALARDHQEVAALQLDGFCRYVQKPFELPALLTAVRDMLKV